MKFKLLLFLFLCFNASLISDEPVLATHAIHFSGEEAFDEETLVDATGAENKSFFQFWKKDNPRIKDKLLPTLTDTIKSFYASEGFYDVLVNLEKNSTTVNVQIKENEPVRIKSIEIQSDYNITGFISMKKGDIFKAKSFIQSKANIIKSLLDDGYCSYVLDTKAYVDLDKHSVELHYILEKGGVCTFGKLTLTGLKTIDDDVVISRVLAKEGERFSTKLIQDTSSGLYGLSAFDTVTINVDRKIYNVIPVDIDFAEMEKPYSVELGLGYDTYVGPRVHAKMTKNNFLGNAQKLNLKTLWSSLEQLAIVTFTKPALLNLYGYSIDFGAKGGYSNLEFDGFREKKTFMQGYLEYNNAKVKLKTGVVFEAITISTLDNVTGNPVKAVNEGNFLLFYPYVDFIYDARDSKLNPKYGYYLAAYGEFGLAQEDDGSAYLKTLFEARFIHTFSDLTLAVVGKVGIVDEENTKGLPESKYFFGGGSYSNRAYGYREIGVILSPSEDSIYGASTMANFSFEADYPVWGDVYGAVFTDNTMLTDSSYDFTGDIISSAGVGVRYMTPIGPFKLDIGFNIAKPSQYGISFQIGQSF